MQNELISIEGPAFHVPAGLRLLQVGDVVAKRDIALLKSAPRFDRGFETGIIGIRVQPGNLHWFFRRTTQPEAQS